MVTPIREEQEDHVESNHDSDEPDNPEPPPPTEITAGEAAKAVKLGAIQGAAQVLVNVLGKHLA